MGGLGLCSQTEWPTGETVCYESGIREHVVMRVWKMIRPPLAAGAFLAGQVARAAYRDDLPSLENQDPSGVFGSPDAKPLTIAYLGDSSVTSPGVKPLDDAWPRQVAMHLSERFYVNAVSVAVGGAKSRDVLESQVDEALEHEPDIAYVAVGSNDALRGTPVARFEDEFDQLVSRLHSNVPAVGLSGIGDLGTIPRLPQLASGISRVRGRAIDRAVGRVAANYPRAIKSNAWTVMHDVFGNDPEMFGDDLFHASASGHRAFATVGRPVADELVEIWLANQRSEPS
jgi:lysophospholipase L1-like esterase